MFATTHGSANRYKICKRPPYNRNTRTLPWDDFFTPANHDFPRREKKAKKIRIHRLSNVCRPAKFAPRLHRGQTGLQCFRICHRHHRSRRCVSNKPAQFRASRGQQPGERGSSHFPSDSGTEPHSSIVAITKNDGGFIKKYNFRKHGPVRPRC